MGDSEEEMVRLKMELGDVVYDPLRRLFDICRKHPDVCNPIYYREPDFKPEPDPVLVLGDSIFQHVNSLVNANSKEFTAGPNTILQNGTVITASGSTWNIKVNPAVKAIQKVLSKEQNAQIAVNQLKNTIKANEKTIAIQKTILKMAQEEI